MHKAAKEILANQARIEKAIEVNTLEARQAKTTSADAARAIETAQVTAGSAQERLEKGIEGGMDKLADLITSQLEFQAKEISRLASRVSREHEERMEAYNKTAHDAFLQIAPKERKIQELTRQIEELQNRAGPVRERSEQENREVTEYGDIRGMIDERDMEHEEREKVLAAANDRRPDAARDREEAGAPAPPARSHPTGPAASQDGAAERKMKKSLKEASAMAREAREAANETGKKVEQLGRVMAQDFTNFKTALREHEATIDLTVTAIAAKIIKAQPTAPGQQRETATPRAQAARPRPSPQRGVGVGVSREGPQLDDDQLMADIEDMITDAHKGTESDTESSEDEMEWDGVRTEPIAVPPSTKSRNALARRTRVEGMEASRHATVGATTHPDRARRIAQGATPPAPGLLNPDGTVTTIGEPRRPPALNPSTYGRDRPAEKRRTPPQAAPRTEGPTGPRPPPPIPRASRPATTPVPAAPARRSYAATAAAPARPGTPAGGWQTAKTKLTKRTEKAAQGPNLNKRKTSTPQEERRIAFTRETVSGQTHATTDVECRQITGAINVALCAAGAPAHIRIELVKRSEKGNLTAAAVIGADAAMLLHFKEVILRAARVHDRSVVDITNNENWQRLKVLVPVAPYSERSGLDQLKAEIEAENEGVEVKGRIRWLQPWAKLRHEQPVRASVIFSVRDRKTAQRLTTSMRIAGCKATALPFIPEGVDTQCRRCCQWGHSEFKCQNTRLYCGLCAGNHLTAQHQCPVRDCQAMKGRGCDHVEKRCVACKAAGHSATAFTCPARRAARAAARGQHYGPERPDNAEEQKDARPASPTNPPGDDAAETDSQVRSEDEDPEVSQTAAPVTI